MLKINFRKKTGFSLVEIVVATLLLAIISAGIFSVSISSRKIINRSHRRHFAAEAAQTVLENLRAYLGEGNWSDTGSPIYNDSVWECHNFNDYSTPFLSSISSAFGSSDFANKFKGDWCYKVEGTSNDYRKATVQVNWTEMEL